MDNPPVKITREYHYLTQGKSAAAGSVRHTFYYKPSQETDLPGFKILFTPQSAVTAGAVSNKNPSSSPRHASREAPPASSPR